MLSRDEFITIIKAQFDNFQNLANQIYWANLNKSKQATLVDPKFELQRASSNFLLNLELLADRYMRDKGQQNKEVFDEFEILMNSARALLAIAVREVTQQMQMDNIKASYGIRESNPVFAELSMKRKDALGRSYNVSYALEIALKQFDVMVALKSDYVQMKAQNVEQVSIMKQDELIKVVKTDDLFSDEVLALFHPNSNLRILPNDSQT